MLKVPDYYEIWEANERVREAKWQREVDEHGIGVCEYCGEPVLDYDSHYDIRGELVHSDCIMEWLEEFKHG